METKTNTYIEVRKNRSGQDRPFITSTRVRVQDIVIDHERFGQSAEDIASGFDHISLAQVHAALSYFFDNREFVYQCIREEEALVEQAKEAAGQASLNKGTSTDAVSSPVSP